MIKYQFNLNGLKVTCVSFGPNAEKELTGLKNVKVISVEQETPEDYIVNIGFKLVDKEKEDEFVMYKKEFENYSIIVSNENEAGKIFTDGRMFVFVEFNNEMLSIKDLKLLQSASSRALELQNDLDKLFERM